MVRQSWLFRSWVPELAFIGAHLVFALVAGKGSALVTWHARGVFVAGFGLACTTRRWDRVVNICGYIMGAEVFWRMTSAGVPWEFAKLATIAILGVAILRLGLFFRRPLAILYILLQLPSVWVTIENADAETARGAISFNLAGPLALAVAVIFFSALRLTPEQLRRFFVSTIAPVVSVATIVYTGIRNMREEDFGFYAGSNKAMSGGFGPNQVAAVLALGTLWCLFYSLTGPGRPIMAVALLALGAGLLGLSALTFTRGGVYMTGAAIVCALFYYLKDPATRRQILIGILVFGAVSGAFVVPRLLSLTKGLIASRFEDTGSTGRDRLIMADLDSWAQNPVLGTGPGMAEQNRARYFKLVPAHTEYSRLPAEHGIFGIGALVVLMVIALQGVQRAKGTVQKALSVSVLCWSLLYMAVDATRIVAPSILFGLAFVTVAERAEQRKRVAAPARSVRLQGPLASQSALRRT